MLHIEESMIALQASQPPLYVDLDGTLVHTDTLWESLVALIRQKPRALFQVIGKLPQGKAAFKHALSEQVDLSPADLPYHEPLLAFLQQQKADGRSLILATASPEATARRIAKHLGLFDHVIASTPTQNLSGSSKRDAILAHAQGPYEYIGDHAIDLPIWTSAARAHAVLPPNTDWHRSIPVAQRGERFQALGGTWKDLVRALRLHQWAKNVLIFLPLFLSHVFTDPQKLRAGIIAFFSFSLSASAIYLVNDIFDIHADRRHPEKRLRPFARGTYAIPSGLLWSGALLIVSLSLAFFLSPLVALCIAGYVLTTCLYTLWLKKVPVVDVVLIGFFYTYRILVGAIATETMVSDWLLVFSAFFFLSLGIEKRYGELLRVASEPSSSMHGRGYHKEDLPVVLGFGLNTAFLSLLVLAFYIRSAEVTKLYTHPFLLWGVVLLLLVWMMRLWLLAHRGIVRDDPLLFTLRDQKSRILFVLILGILIIASL
jgi:4-hydroxybenzoate polyprenyltransferase/phosphoserine phosphatase